MQAKAWPLRDLNLAREFGMGQCGRQGRESLGSKSKTTKEQKTKQEGQQRVTAAVTFEEQDG